MRKSRKPEPEAYKCDSCDELVKVEDAEDAGPLYECVSCGTRYNRANSHTGDNHQCPDCLKFGQKVADLCCPECDEGELRPLVFAD